MTHQPTSGDKERRRIQTDLVDVLELSRLMQGPSSRQLMLDQLRSQLGQLPLREHAELRLQIAELVQACAGPPDGMRTLVAVFTHLEPHSDQAIALRRLADEWDVTDVLSDEDWAQLRPMLETVAPTNLSWLFQRATEYRLPGPPAWCDNAWQVFVHLAGHNAGPDGLPPNMAFLILLENEVDSDIAEWIRQRNRRQAGAHQLTAVLDGRRSRIIDNVDQVADSTAYLVIQVEPDLAPAEDDALDNQDRYLLSHYRQWRGAESWHSRQGRSRPVRGRDLEREVEKLVEQMEIEWADRPGPVVIEFVLPFELLAADVAWWHKESASSRPIPLAMDYPVVVRSLERLRTPYWHRLWHERWRTLRRAPAASVAHWSRPSGQDYFTRLESTLKEDPRVVTLILSEPPSPRSRTWRHELEAGLRAGLPVVIWHRGGPPGGEFRDALSGLISDGGVAQLPLRAKQLRQEALRLEPESRKDHIGRHLTVLWDDPERKPGPLGSAGRVAGEIR
jgi:hypothetical protein